MFCINFKIDNVKNCEESQIFPAYKVKTLACYSFIYGGRRHVMPGHRQRPLLLMRIRHVCIGSPQSPTDSPHSNVEASKWILFTQWICVTTEKLWAWANLLNLCLRTKAVNATALKTCREPMANYLQQRAHVIHKTLITTRLSPNLEMHVTIITRWYPAPRRSTFINYHL